MKKQNNKSKKQKKTFKKRPASVDLQFKGQCSHLDNEGRGVMTYKGESIPVSYVLPGEQAMISATKHGKYYETRIQSIMEKSNQRVQAPCPYFYECGGCQLQHMAYASQLAFKQSQVQKLMKAYGQCLPIIGMEDPWYYRNKITATFKNQGKTVLSGFYKAFSHDVVAIENCMIQEKVADPILATIRQLCKQYKIQIYNEDTKNGFLRHVMIRTGHKTGEVMVVFVVADKIFPSKNNLMKALLSAHPEINTVVMNINNRSTSVVLGQQEIILHGNGTIRDELCGMSFLISSQSFYQINPVQTEKLYNAALDFADIKKDEVVLDTYSGIGTIALLAAQHADEVYGVEINKSAVENAIKNAKLNHIKHVRFVEDDATNAMVQMAKERFKVDVLFMDPPRDGSTPQFLDAALKLRPKKIVYISCNPETQARDLKHLIKKYKVEKIQPVDMFAHTGHVESVCLLKIK